MNLMRLNSTSNIFVLSIRAGQYIDIVPYHDMRQDVLTDFGYRYIVLWRNCCLFLVQKALLQ